MKNVKYITIIVVTAALALFILGCPQPGGGGGGGDSGTVIYLAGRKDLSTGEEMAVQWNNTTRTDLKTGNDYAEAYDIHVFGGNVYTAGYYENSSGYYVAMLWENGSGTELAGGSDDASANAVFVDTAGSVYVGGYKPDTNGSVVGYWKDGTWTPLPTSSDSTYNIKVHDILVDEQIVYAGGHDYTGGNGYRIPVVWDNGAKVLQDLPSEHEDGVVYDVEVSGTDVYAAGRTWDQGVSGEYNAVYWKNGTDTLLHDSSDSWAYGIEIYDGKVYAVGEYENGSNDDVAVIWEDGTPLDLAVNGAAYDIEITPGGDIYVAGYVYEDSTYKTVYWINGTRVDVEGNDTFANTIFIEE